MSPWSGDPGLLGTLLAFSSDLITVKDLEGRYRYANAATLAMMGLPEEAVLGKTPQDLFGEVAARRMREAEQEMIASGRSLSLEVQFPDHAGKPRVFTSVLHPYHAADGALQGIIMVSHEISETKQTQHHLRESEARLRSLIEATFEGLAIHENGVILEANESLAQMFGYPLSELIGMNGIAVAAPEYRELIAHHIRTDYQKPYEVEGIRRDGTRFFVEMVGKPCTYEGRMVRVAAFRDITERKQAEARLQQHDALLKFSQEFSHLGSWEWYIADRRVTWSEELYRLLGFEPHSEPPSFETLLGRVPPEDQPLIKQAINDALQERRPFSYHHRVVTPDGRVRVLHSRGKVELNAEGETYRMIGASQDVSEHHRLEATLREQNEQLQELDRLKSSFISSVSHELRTPLASIVGYAEFLEDEVGGELTPDQRAFVCQIVEGARRLRHLVDDLLDFARFESGAFRLHRREADLAEKIQEIVLSLQPQAQEANLFLEAELPEEPLALSFDPERIGQVLLNLIGNAIKFTPPGGRIDLCLSCEEDHVRVEVRDTGIGIPSEHQPKLFQKFFQIDPSTTRERGGAGLGLSITKALVEAHGGEIGVTSTPGHGATFWFTLPAPELRAGEPVAV